MPRIKSNKELKDYYAYVTVETIVYFQAKDENDAENVAEEIAGNLCFDSRVLYESIDYEGHEVTEINLHD